MKIEQLNAMYKHNDNGYFQLDITLEISGENEYGSNSFARASINEFIANKCPQAHLEFIFASGSNDQYELLYRNTETGILGDKSTIDLVKPYIDSNLPLKINPEMFAPENSNDKTYAAYNKCITTIQEYIGQYITPSEYFFDHYL